MDNKNITRRGWLAILIVVAILVIDQIIKIWVKTNMTLHEQIDMELGSKLVLSLFRVAAIALLTYYIVQQVRKCARWGYIVCLAMVLAGAAGNIFDSMFYGLIFNGSSEHYVSYFVPFGTGYAPFLMGKVVDMFYFPLIVTTWPQWVPMVGGDPFVFFSPIFNFADSSISVGVVLLLLFYRQEISEISFGKRQEKEVTADEEV